MRTLLRIIESAKDGVMPTHIECYWAMLALDAIANFDHNDLRELCICIGDEKPTAKMRASWTLEESFRRNNTAFAKDPKEWVGWSNDPSNPDYQKMRNIAFKVAEKATGINFRE